MRYLKSYTSDLINNGDHFWYIPYGDLNLIIICLKKLNFTKDSIKAAKRIFESDSHLWKALGIYITGGENWTYYRCDSFKDISNGKRTLKGKGLIYKGKISLDPVEIAADKYNL